MSKGLEVLLGKVQDDPSSDKLVERFLTLAAEMPDNNLKIDFLLSLALTLKQVAPRDSLAICRQVYAQVEESWVENRSLVKGRTLRIIEEALLALGRHGKAQVIANEMKKMEDEEMAEREKIRADRFAMPVPTAIPGAPPPPIIPPVLDNPPPLPVVEMAVTPAKPVKKPASKPAAKERKQPPKQAAKAKPKAPEKPAPAAATPKAVGQPRKAPETSPSLFVLDDATKTMGSIEKEKTKETPDTARLEDLQFKDIKKIFQFFDDYYKKNSESEGGSPKAGKGPDADRREKERRQGVVRSTLHAAVDEGPLAPQFWLSLVGFLRGRRLTGSLGEWVRKLKDPDDSSYQKLAAMMWIELGRDGTLSLLEEAHLESQALSFFLYLVDRQLETGRARQAHHLIRSTLHGEMPVEWGIGIWDRLDRIWQERRLQGFAWSPDEGMPALCDRLNSREQPLPSHLLLAG